MTGGEGDTGLRKQAAWGPLAPAEAGPPARLPGRARPSAATASSLRDPGSRRLRSVEFRPRVWLSKIGRLQQRSETLQRGKQKHALHLEAQTGPQHLPLPHPSHRPTRIADRAPQQWGRTLSTTEKCLEQTEANHRAREHSSRWFRWRVGSREASPGRRDVSRAPHGAHPRRKERRAQRPAGQEEAGVAGPLRGSVWSIRVSWR